MIDATKARYTALNAQMNLIGTFDVTYSNYEGDCFAFNDGEDAIFILPAQNNNGGGGYGVLRIDKTGAFQWWQTSDYCGGQYYGDTSRLPYPMERGRFYFPYLNGLNVFGVPDIKANGRGVLMPEIFAMSNPCVSGNPAATFFDSEQSLVSGEWLVPYQFSDDYYCSVWNVSPGGMVLVSQGYLGSGPSDLYNKTTQANVYQYSGPGVFPGGSVYGQSGAMYATNFGTVGQTQYQSSLFKQRIYYGAGFGSCAITNGPTIAGYVYSELDILIDGMPTNFHDQGTYVPCGTDIPGVIAQRSNANFLSLMGPNGDTAQVFATSGVVGMDSGGVTIDSQGNVFALTYPTSTGGFQVYYGKVVLPGLGNSTNIIKGNLRNMARPVSVLGRWQA